MKFTHYLILTVILFIFRLDVNGQWLNPSADFSTLSVNLHFGDSINAATRDAIRIFVKNDYLDDINAIDRRAFKTVLNDERVEYKMDLYLDSAYYTTKGRKTMAWVFFGIGIPCLIVPPAGVYIMYTGLINVARDAVYMRVVYSENLRGPDYRDITFKLTYNALSVKNKEEREATMEKKLPGLVRKYVADRVGKANAFYKSQQNKRSKK